MTKSKVKMNRSFVFWASILGASAVALGAFGAHGLKPLLSAKQIAIFETAVDYHFYHCLALLIVGLLNDQNKSKWLKLSGICFMTGVAFFSGSLYLLSCREILGIESLTFILGPITPIGGLFFIAGWIFLSVSTIKAKN